MQFLIKAVGQHPNLIKPEIETLLRTKNVKWFNNLICKIDTNYQDMDTAISLSATIRFVLVSPIILKVDEIMNYDSKILKSQFIKLNETQSFSVKHFKLGENKSLVNSQKLAGEIGSKFLEIYPHLKVNLSNPDVKIYSISFNSKLFIGILYKEILFKKFLKKSPKRWLYFGGGAIKSELARILVNLMFPLDSVVIDPFCGHGGILREIGDVNYFAIGFEISKKIIREARDNNFNLGYNNKIALIQCDALKKPIRRKSVKMYITDPPYAIQTSTKGRDREELIMTWLKSLEVGSKVILSVPSEIGLIVPTSYEVNLRKADYVHRTLTREILRLRRIK